MHRLNSKPDASTLKRLHAVGAISVPHQAEQLSVPTGSTVLEALDDIRSGYAWNGVTFKGSKTLHEKHGFVKLGSRKLDSGKTVSMQVMGL